MDITGIDVKHPARTQKTNLRCSVRVDVPST